MKRSTKSALVAALLLIGGAWWALRDTSVSPDSKLVEVASEPVERQDDTASRRAPRGGREKPAETEPVPTAVVVATSPNENLVAGPAGPGEIVGRVLLLPGRNSVAGAVVEFYGSPTGGAPVGAGKSTTGANGVFRLKMSSPGRYTLAAALSGHPTRQISITIPASGGIDGVEVLFGGGGAIEGRVIGADGPVADAEMTVSIGNVGQVTCRTDVEGRYRFDDVPAAGSVGVVAKYGASLRTANVEIVAGAVARCDFADQASLVGRLTDGGAPIAGATIWVQRRGGAYSGAQDRTSKSGQFRVGGLELGDSVVTLRFSDSTTNRQDSIQVLRLTIAPGENHADIRLGEGDLQGEISGRILKKSTGAATNHVAIRLSSLVEKIEGVWTDAGLVAEADVDPEGGYRVRALRPGRYRMVVFPTGRIDVDATQLEFDLAFGQRKTDFDVALPDRKARVDEPSTSVLSGSVTNAEDRLVCQGSVVVYAESGRSESSAIDASGRYSIDRLAPGLWRVLFRRSAGSTFGVEVAATTIKDGANALDLKLGASEITGRVFARASGRALTGAEVVVNLGVTERDGTVRHIGDARPRADGTFAIGSAPSGALKLIAWPLIGGLRSAAVDVEVAPGRRTSGVELALDDAVTGTVILVVRDESAAPVTSLVFESMRDGRPEQGSRVSRASSTGVYELSFASGSFTLTLRSQRDGKLAGIVTGEAHAGETKKVEVVLHPAR